MTWQKSGQLLHNSADMKVQIWERLIINNVGLFSVSGKYEGAWLSRMHECVMKISHLIYCIILFIHFKELNVSTFSPCYQTKYCV